MQMQKQEMYLASTKHYLLLPQNYLHNIPACGT